MFTAYKGYAHMVRQVARSQGVKHPDIRGALLDCAGDLLVQVGRSADQLTLLQEVVHYFMGHRVVCVSSALAEQLAETEMDLELEGLRLPFTLFEVCVDDAYHVAEGIPAPGALVMVRPDESTVAAIVSQGAELFRRLAVRAGMPGIPPREVAAGELAGALTMRTVSPYDGGMLHCTIPYEQNRGKSVDNIIQSLAVPMKDPLMVPTDLREKELESRLLRIALGALCYLNTANPECEPFKDRNRASIGIRPEIMLLGGSMKRDVAAHLRKAHWRHLAHPKFRRSDSGGVRVVWVRPALVNPAVESHELPPKETFVPREEGVIAGSGEADDIVEWSFTGIARGLKGARNAKVKA